VIDGNAETCHDADFKKKASLHELYHEKHLVQLLSKKAIKKA
jgi:hypothetical protein